LDDDSQAAEAEQWKGKYLDQLEQFETRQKQWQQADELLRKTISRLALAADGQDPELDKRLRTLRDAIRDRVSDKQLQPVIDTVSDALIRLDERHDRQSPKAAGEPAAPGGGLLQRLLGQKKTPPPQAADAGKGADAGAGSVRDILIQLLERLSLPDELLERVEAIRERIEQSSDAGSWDSVVEQIAELVQAIRLQTQQEKQGMEDFLLQLSERLQAFDRQLASSGQRHDDSLAAGEQLDDAVRQGITGIQTGVREATDLQQVRQVVQAHIDSVLTHMESFRTAEQARYEGAKAELAEMSERLQSLEGETGQLRSRLHDERRQAQTDALTGIPNRLAYEERLLQEIARWKRFATPLVLLVWDVDHFKRINDKFGHRAGDKVLRTIARTLADAVRETDFIARYGGEEFVHLMTGAGLDDCLVVADKLRTRVQEAGFHFRGDAVTVTVSCGVALFRDGDSTETWFERADKALYRAKQTGRNRCEPESG
jgi:diguanylate cyclase